MERIEKEEKDPNLRGIDDLTKLEKITLESVLDCLIDRFNSGHYYTFAGSVLITLNPCLKKGRRSAGLALRSEDNSSPHVYSIGRRCMEGLRRVGNDQIVVVSGDSGAGKTTVTQQLLCYFIAKNEVGMIDMRIAQGGLERKIYCATQILEAFGNASTIANPNSSRFGRLVQIIYGREGDTGSKNLSILGAQIETCLLEKHRVSKCGANERNFHIFYYVLLAAKQNLFCPEKIIKNLLDKEELDSLIPQYFKQSSVSTDAEDFEMFYSSIRTLNMISEIHGVLEIIYGLMILLGLKFVGTSSDEKENDPSVRNKINTLRPRYFRIDCSNACKQAVEAIFKVEFGVVEDSLVARNFCAGRRKSSIRKPCETAKECKERLSAFVTTVYDKLFNHILQRLNSLLGFPTRMNTSPVMGYLDPREMKSISLLDLYGFENLLVNHLEQLCINYANERLQQVHISHLKSYMVEDVGDVETDLKSLEIFTQVDTQIASRIDGLHRHIFSVLDETCVLNRPQTDAQVFSRLTESFKGNPFIRNGKLHDRNYPFIVQHYASTVTYNLRGMVDKNRDYIPPEFLDLLESSQNPLVTSMFATATSTCDSQSTLATKPKSHKGKREKTVLQHFKASVEALVCRLETSNPNSQDVHFIRCIRPNDTLAFGKIQRKLVEQQLYSCGIVDVIRITGNGYPIRLPLEKFRRKFQPLIRCCFRSYFKPGDEGSLNLNTSDLKFGKSQILMTESTWEFLNKVNEFVCQRSVKMLQIFWRNELSKRKKVARRNSLVQEEANDSAFQENSQIMNQSSETKELSLGKDSDDNLSLTQLETSLLNSLPCKITMRRKKKPVCTNALFPHTPRSGQIEFNFSLHTNERKDIVSRRYVFKSPVRFYVKKTPLTNNHLLPRRFLPQGIIDALDSLE